MSGGIPLSSGFNVGAGIPLELKKIQPTLAARNAIPEIQRYEGLEVYVESEETYYYLKGGITNSDWEERASGSGDNYVHPTYINYPNGFYKITTNTLGHVTAATAVTKADVTDLGIPSEDTRYSTITQAEINAGDSTIPVVVTPKLLGDNYARLSHTHSLNSEDITGVLPPSKGGTGLDTLPNNYRVAYWGLTKMGTSSNFHYYPGSEALVLGGIDPILYGYLLIHRKSASNTGYHATTANSTPGIIFGILSSGEGEMWHRDNKGIRFGTNNTQRMSIAANGAISIAGSDNPLTLHSSNPSADNHAVRKGWADDTYALKKAEFVTKFNAFTLVLTDAYKDLMCSGTSEWATTIPTDASVPFEIGTRINIYRTGTGVRRIDAASGVTVYGDRYIRKRYRVVQLVKYATNTWYIIGGEE